MFTQMLSHSVQHREHNLNILVSYTNEQLLVIRISVPPVAEQGPLLRRVSVSLQLQLLGYDNLFPLVFQLLVWWLPPVIATSLIAQCHPYFSFSPLTPVYQFSVFPSLCLEYQCGFHLSGWTQLTHIKSKFKKKSINLVNIGQLAIWQIDFP